MSCSRVASAHLGGPRLWLLLLHHLLGWRSLLGWRLLLSRRRLLGRWSLLRRRLLGWRGLLRRRLLGWRGLLRRRLLWAHERQGQTPSRGRQSRQAVSQNSKRFKATDVVHHRHTTRQHIEASTKTERRGIGVTFLPYHAKPPSFFPESIEAAVAAPRRAARVNPRSPAKVRPSARGPTCRWGPWTGQDERALGWLALRFRTSDIHLGDGLLHRCLLGSRFLLLRE